MSLPLTTEQAERYREARSFTAENILPFAGEWDREEKLPQTFFRKLAERGYLGSSLPTDYGGLGWDTVSFGLLCEALGRGSSSVAVILTVQTMFAVALQKWGTAEQKKTWLPELAKGSLVAGFALTEPGTGSATDRLATEFTVTGSDEITINGSKKWISCAQFAGVFLVFGKLDNQATAFIVPRNTSGLRIEPICGLLGFRAAGLGQLHFDNVRVPKQNLVAKPGFAVSHIAPVSLQYGRISTASSALGLLRGCFEESTQYAVERKIGDVAVGDIGMIRSLLARMGTDLEAGSLLCHSASRAAEDRTPDAFEKALLAKYFTSKAVVAAASDAVQIRGASGCHESSAVSRYYRDAKLMEILEGTTQIHEHLLGRIFIDQADRPE